MHATPPDRAPARPTIAGVATAARVLLALTLAWSGAATAWHLSNLRHTMAVSGLVPRGSAHAAALAWTVVALAAAVALVDARTARAGAVAAVAVSAVALAVTLASWAHGGGVACACVSSTVRRATRDRVAAVAGDVVVLALGCVTLIGTRGPRGGSVGPRSRRPGGLERQAP